MMSWKTTLLVAIGLCLWLAGCKVREPGSLLPNQPPTTTLSVAPAEGSTVNYFITLKWSGNDPDGSVANYRVFVDNALVSVTTATDTTIAFFSPQDSIPAAHSFSVQAVDDQGLADPTPPVRHFSVINRTPTVTFGSAGIGNGDVVGQGFRLSIVATVPRPSITQYSIAIDDSNAWMPWTTDSVFVFAAPEIIADTALFPKGTHPVPNAPLTPGQHTIYIRAQNAGGAVSNILSSTITVGTGADFMPVMDTTVAATYGALTMYPDGSVYFSSATGQVTSLVVTATAPHKNEINAYRFRTGQFSAGGITWNNWNNWQAAAKLDTTDLPPGDYPFQFMARDLANNYTDSVQYIVHIVEQTLSDSVLLVDDTKNGNGAPGSGSPLASTVNAWYDSLLTVAGLKHRQIQATLDPNNPDLSRRGLEYVSPYDVRNAGLLVWHMDDPSVPADISRSDNRRRLLSEYFAKGGRAIISGWNVMAKFYPDVTDSMVYVSTQFAVTGLKMFSSTRIVGRFTEGFNGVNGYPSVFFDSTKVRSQWHGLMPNCFVFDIQGQDVLMGTIALSESTNPNNNRPTAYHYDLSFRVALFGIPLYFCNTDQVDILLRDPNDPAHAHGLLNIMMQGLQRPM